MTSGNSYVLQPIAAGYEQRHSAAPFDETLGPPPEEQHARTEVFAPNRLTVAVGSAGGTWAATSDQKTFLFSREG
jgi:hypothetical protein